jgi:hypothetical protein
MLAGVRAYLAPPLFIPLESVDLEFELYIYQQLVQNRM